MRRNLLIIACAVVWTSQTVSASLALAVPKAAMLSNPKSFENVPDEKIRTNPHAPPDYDPNLSVNDMAVSFYLEPVRILSKSRGAYQVTTTVPPIVINWFSANSVYPYFDRYEFGMTLKKYEEKVKIFLACYAESHKLELKKVADGDYRLNASGTTLNLIKRIKAISDE